MVHKARSIMVQGTASNAGKSIVAAGLCRIFHQDGYAVAPFKSQNMALNSFITTEGLEMGRAQVTQAEAARIEPTVLMNPILLKPTGDAKSQVIVMGEIWNNLTASEYYACKHELRPMIKQAYDMLAAQNDIIVLEGAGSPAEINLNSDDFVNMGMAAMVDAPVLLVGDIDRGGVFASLYGTMMLLEKEERRRVKGIVINKFRGDVSLLRPGLEQLEELCGVPVLGVIPWVNMDIDDEDSVSLRFDVKKPEKLIDIAVIHLPRISNFTDFTALAQHPVLGVRYVESAQQLGNPDLLILPGSKNTMSDLLWMRQNGLEAAIKKLAEKGTLIIGICGGYQMLGQRIADPFGSEQGGEMTGIGLLPIETIFSGQKERTRVYGVVNNISGDFAPLSGGTFVGYEIHMGRAGEYESGESFAKAYPSLDTNTQEKPDGTVLDNVLGTYVHGLFDEGTMVQQLAEMLMKRKGMDVGILPSHDYQAYKQVQFDLLADSMRQALDMSMVYKIMQGQNEI